MKDSSGGIRNGGGSMASMEAHHLEARPLVSLTPPVGVAPKVLVPEAVTESKVVDKTVITLAFQPRVVTDGANVIALKPVETQGDADQFIKDRQDSPPLAISRVADNFVINVGGTATKVPVKFLETALAKGTLNPRSDLGEALMLTELLTNTNLSSPAQRAVHASVTHKGVPMADAQQSAVLGAFVEGVGIPTHQADVVRHLDRKIAHARVNAPAKVAALVELRHLWTAFTDAHAGALKSGDTQGNFQPAYDCLMRFAGQAEKVDPTFVYCPEVADRAILPSSLIAIANGRAKSDVAKTMRASSDPLVRASAEA
ncbi:MAG: hypothetical protein H7338_20700, partial [Candidatus Sericytochromatia bacterium]|nr:hypothetical protein [Candidatus Sericytochromatia bacterium]